MKNIKEIFIQLGFEGSIIAILSVAAIIVALFDFIGGSQLSQPILVGVLGFLLLEIVLQRSRFGSVSDHIISSIKEYGLTVNTLRSELQQEHIQTRNLFSSTLSGDNFLRGRSDYEAFESRTARAKELYLIGAYLSGFINVYQGTIRNLGYRGCKIMVIVMSPTLNSNNFNNEEEVRLSLKILSKIHNDISDRLEVRLVEWALHHRIIATDLDTDHGVITVSLYANIDTVGDRVHFLVHPLSEPRWYDHYNQEIKALWSQAKIFQFDKQQTEEPLKKDNKTQISTIK